MEREQLRDWPDPAEIVGESAVDFTLVYRGSLPCASQSDTRKIDKHRMRIELSPQLRNLWRSEPGLFSYMNDDGTPRARKSEWRNRRLIALKSPDGMVLGMGILGPWQFVEMQGTKIFPLVTSTAGMMCHLDIKFLRRAGPGGIVGVDGDLDNRLKVLFDALRAPHSDDEIVATHPMPPLLFCLLEDDAHIAKFSVEAQTLLEPETEQRPQSYVELHIAVHLKATR